MSLTNRTTFRPWCYLMLQTLKGRLGNPGTFWKEPLLLNVIWMKWRMNLMPISQRYVELALPVSDFRTFPRFPTF